MDINTIRQKYPQYDDLSDSELADAMHKKHYSDMPKDEFYSKIGVGAQAGNTRGVMDVLQSFTPLGMAKQGMELVRDPMGSLQRTDDFMRGAANGLTFGTADRIAGYLGGSGTEAERAKTEEARARNPVAVATGEIGGSVMGAGKLMNAGMTASRFVPKALTGGMGLMARSGASAADALALNELMNAGYGRDFGENAGLSAAIGGAAPVAGALLAKGASKIAGMGQKKPAIPGINDIASAKKAAYDAADDAGVMFNTSGLQKLRQDIVTDFKNHSFLPANEPGAAAVLAEFDKITNGNVTLSGLDAIRKMAGNAYIPGNKSNNTLTATIISHIDDFIANPPQGGVIMGNSAAGANAIKEARSLASREFKLNKVKEALDKAELRAASTGSGGNVDNATRQNLRRILEKPRGLTQDEIAALNKVVRGTTPQNVLRLAGKLSPSGNGLMAALGIGGTMVNPMVGLASLGGMGAKTVADSMTKQNTGKLLDVIAAGGTKAATQAPKTTAQKAIESNKELIARLLMLGGVGTLAAP